MIPRLALGWIASLAVTTTAFASGPMDLPGRR